MPGEKEKDKGVDEELQKKLSQIKRKILVLSGKGGVGKSTVSTNLAVGLALRDYTVGLLDVDIHGPNVPNMLGLKGVQPSVTPAGAYPVNYSPNLKVMSIGFFAGENDAIVWRGPLKHRAIQQFLVDIIWGPLDWLIVDSPPGTGDEVISVRQLLQKVDGAVIVATPQDVALADVRRSIKFCNATQTPILGIIENMSGFVCPKCGEVVEIFKSGGAERLAKELGVPFLGKIPIDPTVVTAGDEGKPCVEYYPDSPMAKAFNEIINKIEEALK